MNEKQGKYKYVDKSVLTVENNINKILWTLKQDRVEMHSNNNINIRVRWKLMK